MEKTNQTEGKTSTESVGNENTKNGQEMLDEYLDSTSPFERWVIKSVSCLVTGDSAVFEKKGNDPCKYTAKCIMVGEDHQQTIVKMGKEVLYVDNYFANESMEDFVQIPLDKTNPIRARAIKVARRNEWRKVEDNN